MTSSVAKKGIAGDKSPKELRYVGARRPHLTWKRAGSNRQFGGVLTRLEDLLSPPTVV